MSELPSYADLPAAARGGRSAWGVFGAEDNLGTLNLLTPERVAAASRLIVRGALFPLDAPLDLFSPALASRRGVPRHTVLHRPGTFSFDDVYDNFYPQAGSQWDSLGHVGYDLDAFYNGATEAEVASGRRNTIEHAAAHGVAGRGVLLDLERTLASRGADYDPGGSSSIGVAELEAARADAGVEIEAGDLLLLHTGFGTWYRAQGEGVRAELPTKLAAPGLAHEEAICEWLWDHHVAAVFSDTFAVEVWPRDLDEMPFGYLHRVLIGQFGISLGELWWLADLAADCALDGRYECFLASTPMRAPGGIGSPANALAIK